MELIVHSICWRCGTINPLLFGDWCYKCARAPDMARELKIEADKAKGKHNWHGDPLWDGKYVYYMGRWRG